VPRKRTLGDSISTAASAAKQITGIVECSPAQVRDAQLALVGAALGDLEREADLAEVLAAMGIYNRQRRVVTAQSKIPIGLKRGPLATRQPGEREPNGRLSRAKGVYKK